jgi:hypothetical protein
MVRFGVIETTAIKIIEELQRDGFNVSHVYMAKEVAYEEVGTEKKLANLLAKLSHKVPLTLFHSRSLGRKFILKNLPQALICFLP